MVDDASRTRQVAQTVGDDDLFDFYNAIIPNTVTSVADLAKWWKTKHDEQPDLLDFDPDKVERLAGLILCPWTTIPTIGIRSAPTAPPSI